MATKIYENEVKEDFEFPNIIDYGDIAYSPQNLEDINKTQGDQFAQNITDIAGNTSNITANATQISLNVTDIAGNAASIVVNAGNINLRVEKNDVINQINISTEGIKISGSKISISGTTTFSSGWESAANVGNLAAQDSADYATQVSGTKPPANADHTADIVSAMAYESMVESAKLGTTIISGGYIKSSLLTAENIVTGTLTAIKVQTSSSGMRVVLDNSTNSLRFYDSGGGLAGYIQGGSGGKILISGINYLDMGTAQLQARDILVEAPSGAGISVLWNDSTDIGTTAHRFRHLYLGSNFYINGNIYLSAASKVGGSIIPTSSGIVDIGMSSRRYRNIYTGALYYTGGQLPDDKDDLALIKKITPGRYEGASHNIGDQIALLIGSTKQLIERVEELENQIN